jgi:hypothetical protein
VIRAFGQVMAGCDPELPHFRSASISPRRSTRSASSSPPSTS